MFLFAAAILWSFFQSADGFLATPSFASPNSYLQLATTTTTDNPTTGSSSLEKSVENLKNVLKREYASFFDPMVSQYYSSDVSFTDPMTALSGVDQYQKNVDMLASRTLLGKFLFEDASIVLHSVTGGEVSDDGKMIENIVTRWTLRVSVKVLPWSPRPSFTGISVYKVTPQNEGPGVQIVDQVDFWDSINIREGGSYEKVDKSIAVSDFLNQLKPEGLQASSAGQELPFTLLRRGNGYEVRRYPAISSVEMPYERRDEGFSGLGSFTQGMNALSPAIMEVPNNNELNKVMSWPLTYALPGDDIAPEPKLAIEKAGADGQWRKVNVKSTPAKVVAVREFTDASMEPVVRKADRELRSFLRRDGIEVSNTQDDEDGGVKFAQYDAIYSMGKRRGEVWIELKDGQHPW